MSDSTADQSRPKAFYETPLITPERLAASPEEALAVQPDWVAILALTEDDVFPPLGQTLALLAKGSASPQPFICSTLQCAFLFEATRFGHSVVTNTNSGNPPRVYPKFSFEGAPADNFPTSRIWMNAGAYQAVGRGDNPRDERLDELHVYGAGKPTKDARAILMRHVERVARERVPEGYDIAAYLANLHALLALIDAERTPPTTPTE